MKTRKIATVRAGKSRIQMAAALTLEEWDRFKTKALEAGQSLTGRLSWLVRKDLKDG